MDFDALMKKKLGGKYNKPSLVESLPQTEDGQDQAKPKNKGQKKATFKPRHSGQKRGGRRYYLVTLKFKVLLTLICPQN